MSRDDDILDLQQWCTDHSHADLYARLEQQQELVTATIGLLTAVEQRLANLERWCKQCYLESKGEGP